MPILIFICVWALAFFLRRNSIKKLIFAAIIGSVTLASLVEVVGENESLARRYDISNTDYIGYTTASRSSLAISATESILANPLGQGFTVNRVEYRGTKFQPHNQFLTLGLASGIAGILASIIWIWISLNLISKNNRSSDASGRAIAMSLFTITLTLFTNDISGAIFFFAIILLGYSGLPPRMAK